LDFIFDNLFIIVPVIIILAVRMIGSRIKQAKADSSQQEEEQQPVYEEEPATTLGHWESEKPAPVSRAAGGASAPARPLPGAVRPAFPESGFLSRQDLEPAKPRPAPVSGAMTRMNASVLKPVQVPVRPSTGNPLSRLDYLPVLKKAVVFSEILSPPKALRQD